MSISRICYCILAISLAISSQLMAAQPLDPEKAAELVPFKNIVITGKFDSIRDTNLAVARRAEQLGATGYIITATNPINSHSGNSYIYVSLYSQDSPTKTKTSSQSYIKGVRLLSKDEAKILQPSDTITTNGFYSSQPDVNYAIAKLAKARGAAAFYITRQNMINGHGGNQTITAELFSDKPKYRVITLKSNSNINTSVVSNVSTNTAQSTNQQIVGHDVAHQTARTEREIADLSRYAIKLADGKVIEEINNATAAQMKPLKKITLSGHFSSPTDLSITAAKRAAKYGAKYYHIAHQSQNRSGGNLTAIVYIYQ